MFGHLPVTSPHAIRTGSWLGRVASTSRTAFAFLAWALPVGVRQFRARGGPKLTVAAAAIAASLSLAPVPAGGARTRTRQLPYPTLAFPLVIGGSQYAPLAWSDIAGWNEDDHL